jgi:hypothetical protein
MKIEIQASGEDIQLIAHELNMLAEDIRINPWQKSWSVSSNNGIYEPAKASAVVVQEEEDK